MSTHFEEDDSRLSDWISQAEAARLQGVTRQAIHKLVRSGRLRSRVVGGHVLVSREDLEGFRPQPAGRPKAHEMRRVERLKALLEKCDHDEKKQIFEFLRNNFEFHPIEKKLGVRAEVILEAIERSAELTVRMFRGVLAEAAFEIYVVNNLEKWENVEVIGSQPYDFVLRQPEQKPIRVQVKLQRSSSGVPWRSDKVPRKHGLLNGFFVVETQRTRKGDSRKSGEATRPYHFGQFDILAVAMQPSTEKWDSFRYTVADWLLPRKDDATLIDTYQPVAMEENEDWTDSFETCVSWFRQGRTKSIGGRMAVG